MDGKEPSIVEQYAMLRDLTRRTGALHEAQVLNLKYWPRIALPHSVKSTCCYDFKKKIVEFDVVLGKAKPPKDLKRRVDDLVVAVRSMLGEEHTVIIKKGSKVLFTRRPKPLKKKDVKRINRS